MKRYISLVILSLMCAMAQASQLPDSVAIYRTANADSVVIIHTDKGVTVNVINHDGDEQNAVTFTQPTDKEMVVTTSTRRARKRLLHNEAASGDASSDSLADNSHWDVSFAGSSRGAVMLGGLSFGFNTAFSAPQDLDVEPSKSYEIGLLYAIAGVYKMRGNRDNISFGLGFNWRNYRMTKSVRFIPADGMVRYGAYPEGVTPKGSRLLTFSLNLPLVYTHNWSRGAFFKGFYVGGIVNFNTFGSVATKWLNADGNEVEELNRNIGQRKVTVDVMAGLNIWGSLSIYAKYSPMKVLNSGPQFSSLTTGLMLGF